MEIRASLVEMQTFENLCPLIEKAEEKLSFWGARFVCIPGYDGTVSIDVLSMLVSKIVENNFDFDEKERTYGKKIAERILQMYDNLQNQKERSNFFTQILAEFRMIFSRIHRIENAAQWWGIFRVSKCDGFDYYTRKQFQKAFVFSPENAKRKGFSLIEKRVNVKKHYPDRWKVVKQPPSHCRIYDFCENLVYNIFPPPKKKPTTGFGIEWKSDVDQFV